MGFGVGHRTRIAGWLTVTALVVGCSGGPDDAAAPEVPTITQERSEHDTAVLDGPVDPPPSDTRPDRDGDDGSDDSTVVHVGSYDGYPIDEPVPDPSVIDPAYVEEVLRVLDRNFADLVLAVQQAGVDDFGDQQYAEVLPQATSTAVIDLEAILVDHVVRFADEGWFQDDPSPVRSSVEDLLTVTQDCVAAAVIVEADPLYTVPVGGRWYVGLEPRQDRVAQAGTIWRFADRGPDVGEVVDVCA